jgi:hypothetical protein
LIAFDISLEILPKRRKLLVRILKDTLPSQQGDTIQAYELIIFSKLRIIYQKLEELRLRDRGMIRLNYFKCPIISFSLIE